MGDDLGVGFAAKRMATLRELFAQIGEVLDNAVVHDRDVTCA